MRAAPGGLTRTSMRRRWRWLAIGAGFLALAWGAFARLDLWRARGELRLAQQEIAGGRLEAARRRLTGLAANPGTLGGAAVYWLGICESLGGRSEVPVHRPSVLTGQETLITPIEMSDQPRARHDFNLLEAGLSTRPGVSRDGVSAHGQPPLPHHDGTAVSVRDARRSRRRA